MERQRTNTRKATLAQQLGEVALDIRKLERQRMALETLKFARDCDVLTHDEFVLRARALLHLSDLGADDMEAPVSEDTAQRPSNAAASDTLERTSASSAKTPDEQLHVAEVVSQNAP